MIAEVSLSTELALPRPREGLPIYIVNYLCLCVKDQHPLGIATTTTARQEGKRVPTIGKSHWGLKV